MNTRNQLMDLDDHVIENIVRVLDLHSVLSFGVTNRRIHGIVNSHFSLQQQRFGPIDFVLNNDDPGSRNYLEWFGSQLQHLELRYRTTINMDIFDEIRVDGIERLQLQLSLIEEVDDYDGFFSHSASQSISNGWIDMFSQSVENVVHSINSRQMTSLQSVKLVIDVALTAPTYNASAASLSMAFDTIAGRLFGQLRRGNMTTAVERMFQVTSIRYTIHFD